METRKSENMDNRALFKNLVRADLSDYAPASNLSFNEKVNVMRNEGKTVHHLAFGQAPFPIMDSMVEALKEYAHRNEYLPVAGIPELRQAIVGFHQHYDGLDNITPDQVVTAPGTKELIFLCLNVFDGEVMVLSPSWTTYKPQSMLAHHMPHVITLHVEDNWRLTPQLLENTILEKKLTGNKLLIMCNPDNPTGTCYKEAHLKELSIMMRKHNVIVISDEIYGRLHFDQQHESLAKYYPEGTILSAGFSKWASAGGWRMGYHIYPPELKALRDSVRSAASHTYSCAPAPMQFAIAKALRNIEECDHYIKHTARIMAAAGDFSYRELTSAGVKCHPSTAGYYIFPDFEVLRDTLASRGITTCSQMCAALLKEVSVALMAGGPAFLRPEDEFTTRLCFVCFDGKHSLQESLKIGLENPLPANFVKLHCNQLFEAIMALKGWVLNQLNK